MKPVFSVTIKLWLRQEAAAISKDAQKRKKKALRCQLVVCGGAKDEKRDLFELQKSIKQSNSECLGRNTQNK